MLTYPQIDPLVFNWGPFYLSWYYTMYLLSAVWIYLMLQYRTRELGWKELKPHLLTIVLICLIAIAVGGRLGYLLFYDFSGFIEQPKKILNLAQGRSAHGAYALMCITLVFYCRFSRIEFWKFIDVAAVSFPLAIGFGRIGNFINGELWGRVTDLPWAMVFPDAGPLPRHPSQLYEALLEGVLLFAIVWMLRNKPWQAGGASRNWPHGSMFALVTVLYCLFRFLVEFVREPDAHLGFLWFGMTMGQLLSLGLATFGILLWWVLKQRAMWRQGKQSGS